MCRACPEGTRIFPERPYARSETPHPRCPGRTASLRHTHVARGIRELHHTGISGRQLLRQQRVSLRVRGKPAQNQQGGQHYTSQHIFSLEREHRKRSLRALHFHLTLNPHRAFLIQPGHPRILPTNNAAGPRPDTAETLFPSAPPGDVFPTENFHTAPPSIGPYGNFWRGRGGVWGGAREPWGCSPFFRKVPSPLHSLPFPCSLLHHRENIGSAR